MSESQTKAGNQECLAKLAKLTLSMSFTLMLNNFVFMSMLKSHCLMFIGENGNGVFYFFSTRAVCSVHSAFLVVFECNQVRPS